MATDDYVYSVSEDRECCKRHSLFSLKEINILL